MQQSRACDTYEQGVPCGSSACVHLTCSYDAHGVQYIKGKKVGDEQFLCMRMREAVVRVSTSSSLQCGCFCWHSRSPVDPMGKTVRRHIKQSLQVDSMPTDTKPVATVGGKGRTNSLGVLRNGDRVAWGGHYDYDQGLQSAFSAADAVKPPERVVTPSNDTPEPWRRAPTTVDTGAMMTTTPEEEKRRQQEQQRRARFGHVPSSIGLAVAARKSAEIEQDKEATLRK